MDEPCITLVSSGLLSKWGNGDGEAPDEWLDYCDNHGIDYNTLDYPLVELVRRYLLPKLAEHHDIETYVIETIHNPVRAARVDGVEIDPLDTNDEVELSPRWVAVPMAEVARIAREIAQEAPVDESHIALNNLGLAMLNTSIERANRAEAALARVRELHPPRTLPFIGGRKTICQGCGTPHPCPTVRAIGREDDQ